MFATKLFALFPTSLKCAVEVAKEKGVFNWLTLYQLLNTNLPYTKRP